MPVKTRMLAKADAFAYITARGEDEVLVDPM
jgi:hypothetical protein